jgi:isopenicillin N synthase-like dioxygenase
MEGSGVQTDCRHFTNIPTLDYGQTTRPDTRQEFLGRLRDALVNVGFMYLKNPPVPMTVQEKLVEKAKEMFDLPLEKKEQLAMVNSKHFLGYTRLGDERQPARLTIASHLTYVHQSFLVGGMEHVLRTNDKH